jgi:uncharacterized protein (UPF0332 family)
MGYESWRRDGRIKAANPDPDQVVKQLGRALKDLRAAEAVSSTDRTWAFTIAYHAMVRAGRALMLSLGYLPTNLNSHRTVIEFARGEPGDRFGELLRRFDRMRRKRHDFIYDSENATTEHEAREAITAAQELIQGIRERVGDPRPIS